MNAFFVASSVWICSLSFSIRSRNVANQVIYLDLLNDYADQILETEDSIDAIVGFMESDRKKNKGLYPNLYKLCER